MHRHVSLLSEGTEAGEVKTIRAARTTVTAGAPCRAGAHQTRKEGRKCTAQNTEPYRTILHAYTCACRSLGTWAC